MENNNKFFDSEYKNIRNANYVILIFPYLITGVPGIIKEYFDNIHYIHENFDTNLIKSGSDLQSNILKTNNIKSKGLIITHTDFTQESYQPHSLHQSTIKRRLHCLNWMTLNCIGIEPLEPVVLYSPVYNSLNQHFSKKSTLESFQQFNSKKTNPNSNLQPSHIPNISGINNQDNSNLPPCHNDYVNTVESKSINISRNSINKKRSNEIKYKDDFLLEISKIDSYLDLLPRIDLTDI